MIQAVRDDIHALLNQGLMHQGQNLSLYFSRLCKEIDEPRNGEHKGKEFAIQRLESGLSQEAFELYRHAYRQWRKAWEQDDDALSFEMESRTPLIVGMGDQNIHEFGLSLQHPWGTPFIPGTAVKGVAAACAQRSGNPDWQRELKNSEPDGEYAGAVFGGINADREQCAGGIGFADAWWIPDNRQPFQTDIINVHYRTYYQGLGGAWPDGTDSPLPVQFIVIRPKVRFLFVLTGNRDWCKVVKDILIAAANDSGFGGKTRVGYGRMQYVESARDLLERLNSMNTAELANLFQRKGNQAEYKNFFFQAVRQCPCVPELHGLFRKYRPAALFLARLKETNPRNLADARVIRDQFNVPANEIDRTDPDIQAIFNFCYPLANADVTNTWLNAFAYGFDNMVQGKTFDDTAYTLMEHLEKLEKGKTQWPTKDRIHQDISKLTNLKEEERAELHELL